MRFSRALLGLGLIWMLAATAACGSSGQSSSSTSSSSGASSGGNSSSGSSGEAAPTCSDGNKNGGESDVDCGGTCATKCVEALACATDGDCLSGNCKAQVCAGPAVAQLAASATGDTTCARSTAGSVFCWGDAQTGVIETIDYSQGSPIRPPGKFTFAMGAGRSATSVGVGGSHSCVVLDNGEVLCRGGNYLNQLGAGATGSSAADLGPGRTARAVAAGAQHSCALLNDETAKCWGGNSAGQAGVAPSTSVRQGEATALDFGSGRRVRALSAGNLHACALLDDGSLRCWGIGSGGALGTGDNKNATAAEAKAPDLGSGRTAKAVSAGVRHTCALLDEGSVKCWGLDSGQLGIGPGSTNPVFAPPAQGVALGAKAVAIGSGYGHTCALLEDGRVKCWGSNQVGQAGIGQMNEMALVGEKSTDLGSGRTAKAIAVGTAHTCALLDDRTVKCWGYNHRGQLGDETNNNSATPVPAKVTF